MLPRVAHPLLMPFAKFVHVDKMGDEKASPYVFAELGTSCVSPECDADGYDVQHYKTVVVRFENQAAFDMADGCMFDMVYDAFNAGLPESWSADDALELVDTVKQPEHYVIYPLKTAQKTETKVGTEVETGAGTKAEKKV